MSMSFQKGHGDGLFLSDTYRTVLDVLNAQLGCEKAKKHVLQYMFIKKQCDHNVII